MCAKCVKLPGVYHVLCQSLHVLSSKEQRGTTDPAHNFQERVAWPVLYQASLYISDRHASPTHTHGCYTDARHTSPTQREPLGAPGNIPGMTVSPQAEHCEEKALQ